MREPRADLTVKDIADAMRRARPKPDVLGRTIVLIGAGCSISAGIPGAAEIARRMCTEMAEVFDGDESARTDAVKAYAYLVAQGKLAPALSSSTPAGTEPTDEAIDWYRVYDEMFRTHYAAPDQVRDLFGSLVKAAGGRINWAHLCLGECVARNLVSTVLTTNFDQLVLSGLVSAGVLPVVCDGVESLNRISAAPTHPQLVELHGSRHTYLLRNRPEDVGEVAADPSAIAAIQGLFGQARAFVVIGYGGREDGVMDLLVKAAEVQPDKPIYWVAHTADPGKLSDKAKVFLSTTRTGGAVLGQDADEFFLRLCAELGIGTPSTIRDPLAAASRLIDAVGPSHRPDGDIGREIDRARRKLDKLKFHSATTDAELSEENEASAIREARLAGRIGEASALADAASSKAGGIVCMSNPLLREAALAWLDWGRGDPDPGVLTKAVEAYIEDLRRTARHLSPQDWATIQNNLGAALRALGEREPGTARLEEAVAAYRAALEERTRARAPLDWAMTQSNLGNALRTLGEREPGTARLEEAVAAYRVALEERTRTRVPLGWATTQNNLGNALLVLGEREPGTARLEEAVSAHRMALEERTRARVPLDWAMTQNNLGNALRALGEREPGTARLEEAVSAYRAALEERTRARAPLDWAATQNNLGNALRALGEREPGTARLEEAVSAYRVALEERTRARVPLDWAMTQNNLGTALSALGEREPGTARLEEAVSAYRVALEERTRARAPLDWAMTQSNLGNALKTLGEREPGTARLEEAVAAYRAALEEYTRPRVPLDWAMTQNNLGAALSALGERDPGTARLEEAVAAYRAALEVATPETHHRLSRLATDGLARVEALLAARRGGG